jgi:hypothetical protein
MVKTAIDCEIDSTIVNILMVVSFILGFLIFRKLRGNKRDAKLGRSFTSPEKFCEVGE